MTARLIFTGAMATLLACTLGGVIRGDLLPAAVAIAAVLTLTF